MATGLITHSACLGHTPPRWNPETAARLRAVLDGLDAPAFRDLVRLEAPRASEAALLTVHTPQHVKFITAIVPAQIRADCYVYIDNNTVMTPGSSEAALRAAGAVIAGVDGVHEGRLKNAFCAVRPPGHHAESARAGGFCVFNNVAVGAAHARRQYGYRRIAIIDFDVHHGNGTQEIFWSDSETLYASSHQWPLYPGSGRASERGGTGNVCNAPLAAGAGSIEFRKAYERQILPALQDFAPDFVFISAGFDGHYADPLAELRLTESDFAWVTSAICEIAGACCAGRVVSTLEGGYDLEALARSAEVHVRALMEA